ncbi:hypothetical protein [Agrobacterium cavarae]|uniref:hypothetical protein n=1 Tax=Agrobacterium cavarae TaxID=2528239 RepID=UPI003CFE186B
MLSTLLAPTEAVTSSLEVKRALLTYDSVYIPHPEDREFFPQKALFPIMFPNLPMMGIGFSMGRPIKPLSQVENFDTDFEKLLDDVQFTRHQGTIDVLETYNLESARRIGSDYLDGYPINPQFLLNLYLGAATDEDIMVDAINKDPLIMNSSEDEIHRLAAGPTQQHNYADGDLPDLEWPVLRPELRYAYSVIARARIAHVLKTIGFCAMKQLVPTFSHPNYVNVTKRLQARATDVLDAVSKVDATLALRNTVLSVAHDEYVDESVLSKIGVDDVIKLRTRAWGEHAEKRDLLLQSAAELAKENADREDFSRIIREKITDYRKTFDELATERRDLRWNVKCTLALGAGAVATSTTVADVQSAMSQVQTAWGAATMIFAASLWAGDKFKDAYATRNKILEMEADFRDDLRYGIHQFYSGFGSL